MDKAEAPAVQWFFLCPGGDRDGRAVQAAQKKPGRFELREQKAVAVDPLDPVDNVTVSFEMNRISTDLG